MEVVLNMFCTLTNVKKIAKIAKKWRSIALMYKVKEYIQTLMLNYLVYKHELLNPPKIISHSNILK